jgi:hemerythrin superfamily protein
LLARRNHRIADEETEAELRDALDKADRVRWLNPSGMRCAFGLPVINGREAEMARSTRKVSPLKSLRSRGRSTTKEANRPGKRATGSDAISLLKSDHREVEGWFKEFEKTGSSAKKQGLAQKICTALKAHTTIEEEIFYPAFLEATDEKEIHHEAQVEHDGAKKLIAEIEAAGPEDDYYEAKVSVLSEMIKHHVKDEEQRGGMFSKARQSEMDLDELGAQLQQRKDEVMAEGRSAAGSRASSGRRRGGLGAALLNRNGKGREESPARRS